MTDSTQHYPPEFAFLRRLPPADLRQWVIDHSTPRSSQLEAQIDGMALLRWAIPGKAWLER